jgi:transcriptional regulator with XRE-family HTH domain
MTPTLSKLLQLRFQKKFSQEDVAASLNISQRAVSNLETGKTILKPQIIKKLAELYSISPCELCNLSSETKCDEDFELLKNYLHTNKISANRVFTALQALQK